MQDMMLQNPSMPIGVAADSFRVRIFHFYLGIESWGWGKKVGKNNQIFNPGFWKASKVGKILGLLILPNASKVSNTDLFLSNPGTRPIFSIIFGKFFGSISDPDRNSSLFKNSNLPVFGFYFNFLEKSGLRIISLKNRAPNYFQIFFKPGLQISLPPFLPVSELFPFWNRIPNSFWV